ncbi:legumin B [Vigna radiata var. radiata]|uniref:Legumin B n=1 Tax=Vigna radiata var. radiata TaxID=3916 RepID=A0A1S3UJ02_VIGRR|nr:legumin B [Vigna radiata var. radiata]
MHLNHLVPHFFRQKLYSFERMAIDLTPKKAEALFEGDGGGYYTWTTSQVPLLAKEYLGAGRLLLQPRGFALPHYADSSKLGYVIQGSDGVAGMVLPNSKEEVVVKLEKGDVIAVPVGAVSWWFNDGDTDLVIVFLGETSKALIPGQFTYFFLTGAIGVIGGFSTDLTSKVYGLDKNEVEKLTRSQTGVLIIKLDKTQPVPKPQLHNTKKLVYNIDGAEPENAVEKAGLVKTLTEKDFGSIEDVGLSLIRVKLEPNAIKAPSYPVSPTVELIYIARGSGKIEIVDFNGKSVLNTQVEAGDLVVVPQFFVVAEIAGEEGLESYSIVTTTKPLFEELAGKTSIWSIFSSTLQQVALNVDSDFQKLFISKIKESTNLIPPST